MKTLKISLIGICLGLFFNVPIVTAQSVTIDLNTEYQSIAGFGGMNMPGWIDDLTEDQADKAFGNEPGQMGFTMLRVRVPYDTTQFFREVPTAVRAANHGAIVFASPWSPPPNLKSNNNIVGGYLLPENYGAYADHLLHFALYMRKNGAPLYAVSLQNEPDIQVSYESCDWSAQQMIDFLKDQGPKLDTLNVIVNSTNPAEFWLEVECGQVGSVWNVLVDNDASNGEYVTTPAGTESLDSASVDTAYHIMFPIHVSKPGLFRLWGRVITPTANDDSYWIKMDDDAWALWNSIPAGNTWHWEIVFDQSNNSEVMAYQLNPGNHTLSICLREDGALLDKLYLTNTGAVPSELGEEATNCPVMNQDNTDINYNEVSSVLVFPNPAKNEIQVTWKNKFTSVLVFSMDGRNMFHKKYPAPVQNANLNMNLEPGMYFVLLRNEKTSGISKLIIE
jgi:hypothetical protein